MPQPGSRNRLRIAVLIYAMTNAVIFGAGLITVLNVPALSADAPFWIPVVVLASLILAAPIAWLIAPRLQHATIGATARGSRAPVEPKPARSLALDGEKA